MRVNARSNVSGARRALAALVWSWGWVSATNVAPTLAVAADVPVAGRTIALRASPRTGAPRRLSIVLRDSAIAAPFADPRRGSALRIRGGTAPGQCDVRIDLDAGRWKALRGDGTRRGYRYRARRPGTRGIRAITLRPGRIVIRGRGTALPCRLSARQQRVPLSIELVTNGGRYCAAFGGGVSHNDVGRFVARRAGAPAACHPAPQNVVVLVADDLGYADLGIQGSRVIPTPHIDGLAAEGVRFTNAYVTAATCSPSRAGLLSGRYQQRFGFEFNTGPRELTHSEGRGLDPAATTIGDVLAAAGYATGMVGKWHLGSQDPFHPLARGFDQFFGFLIGAHPYFSTATARRETWETVMRGRERANETAYLTDAFAREAVNFIADHRDGPFFLYVPFNAVHTPIQAPDEYTARFAHVADPERRAYYAMVSALDDAVGSILRAIATHGLADRTLVVFTNDNGGTLAHGDNAPLRLGKAFLFEGGIRVPLIMRWPAVTAAGQVRGDIVSTLDLFPTFLDAADTPRPDDLDLDGIDLGPSLQEQRPSEARQHLFWRNGPNRAVRRGDWKLIQAGDHVWLFDLASDVGERTNLATTEPTVVRELLDALGAWEAGLLPPRWQSRDRDIAVVDGVPYEIHL